MDMAPSPCRVSLQHEGLMTYRRCDIISMKPRGARLLNELNDSEVIDSILLGKADDFEIILKRYEAYVFSIVSRHVPRDMVEESCHEVFIRIYKSLHTYRAKSPFRHWISKIAVRYCYDFWREHYRSNEMSLSSLDDEHNKWIETALSKQSQEHFDQSERLNESRKMLQWALGKLSAEERMVITLVHLEELPVKEAADLLGWSVINVKVRTHRARNKLRKVLSALLKERRSDNGT